MSAQDTSTISILTDGAQNSITGTVAPQNPEPQGLSVTSKMAFDDTGKPVVPQVEPQADKVEAPKDTTVPTIEDQIKAHEKAAADARSILTDKGVDVAALSTEWTKNGGKLSDATVQALEQAGFSRDMQETFIAGQQARAAQVEAGLHALAGGTRESYESTFTWARDNMSPEELGYIKNAYTSGDLNAVKMVVKSVYAQMQAAKTQSAVANRLPPVLPEGNPQVRLAGAQAFRSQAEQQEAFSDKRYSTSAAYREEVQRRVAATMGLRL